MGESVFISLFGCIPHGAYSTGYRLTFVPFVIRFPPNALSQQDPGFIAHITLDPDNPNAWVSSHDDMSSDATPSGAFLSVPDPRTARCSLMAPSPKPRIAPAAHITVSQLTKPPHPVTLASSSVSPSLFASPSRVPTFKRRDQAIVHNPAISTAKEGVVEHSPLSCEHENHANPETRTYGREHELRHLDAHYWSHHDGPIQVCLPRCPFFLYVFVRRVTEPVPS
jgi:hypothetical protein